MTIKDLLDVYDKNRDHNDQWVKFVDGNFETVAKITSGDDLWSFEDDVRDYVSSEIDKIMGWENG